MIPLHILAPSFNHKWILHMMGDELAGAYWSQCGPRCNYTGVSKNITKRNKNGTDFSKGNYANNPKLCNSFKKHGVTGFMFISSRLFYYIIEGFILEVFEELKNEGDKTIANQKFSFGCGGDTGQSKPFELRNTENDKILASFRSLTDEVLAEVLGTIKTPDQVSNYLKDVDTRSVMLCFWNFGVLCYLCYKDETVKELELRTGRSFEDDVAAKLRFIPEVTVTNGTETHHLKGYKSYAEAARMLGLSENFWKSFVKLIQRKYNSCDGWRVVA